MSVNGRAGNIQNGWMRLSRDGVRGMDMVRQLESFVGWF